METLTHKMRCGCTFDEHGALLNRCAGHADTVVLQRGKHYATVTPIRKPKTSRSSDMLGLVLIALIALGFFFAGYVLKGVLG